MTVTVRGPGLPLLEGAVGTFEATFEPDPVDGWPSPIDWIDSWLSSLVIPREIFGKSTIETVLGLALGEDEFLHSGFLAYRLLRMQEEALRHGATLEITVRLPNTVFLSIQQPTGITSPFVWEVFIRLIYVAHGEAAVERLALS